VTRSSKTLPPVHSRKEARPRPRSLPRARDCARGSGNPPISPAQALDRGWSRTCRCHRPAHGVGVGHLLRLDEIAAADLDGIDAELAGGGVEQTLDEIDGLGSPGAAIGGNRRGVVMTALKSKSIGLMS